MEITHELPISPRLTGYSLAEVIVIGALDRDISLSSANDFESLTGKGVMGKVVMRTGDSHTTAAAVAEKLGIDQVLAEVLPDQKTEVVKQLHADGPIVVMAGDGINDAPALAQSHVGVTMGT